MPAVGPDDQRSQRRSLLYLERLALTVFPRIHADMQRRWPRKTPHNIVVDLGRTLTQVGPRTRILEEAVLVGSFSRPHHPTG